ncbi:hypothetical protein BSLG_010629 [Batrachochytrium salamandrivorans]|nr:hypothetical protein BSLG_010629 [Batrachochytrium salamandrivorans]
MGIKHYNILKLGAALPPLPNASLPSVNPLLANPRNPDTAQNSIVTDASARRSIQGLVETHNHVVSGKLNTVLDDPNDDHGSNPLTTTRPAAAGFHPDEASHTATNAVASSTAYSLAQPPSSTELLGSIVQSTQPQALYYFKQKQDDRLYLQPLTRRASSLLPPSLLKLMKPKTMKKCIEYRLEDGNSHHQIWKLLIQPSTLVLQSPT